MNVCIDDFTSVSYTHLDVYKRQRLFLPVTNRKRLRQPSLILFVL